MRKSFVVAPVLLAAALAAHAAADQAPPAARLRHLQGAGRDRHGHRDRRHRRGGRGDGGAPARRRLPAPRTCRCSSPRRARATSSRGCAAPARAGRSCCSRTSTSSRRKREDWSTDPFKLVEQDGYFYGARHRRRQVHGGGLRREPDPLQAGGLPARSRHRRSCSRPTRRRSTATSIGITWLLENQRAAHRRRVRAQRGRRRRPRRTASRCASASRRARRSSRTSGSR